MLDIDGERSFGYESVYLDRPTCSAFASTSPTSGPRFKVRTRLYSGTEACVFEVKVKTAQGRTVKRHLDRDPAQHGEIDDEDARSSTPCSARTASMPWPSASSPA